MSVIASNSDRNAKRPSPLRRHMLVLALSTALAASPVSVSVFEYPRALAAPVVGTSAAVQGKVFVSTQGAERKARIKEQIQLNDVVTTKQDSALQVLLLDESTLTVGQNCVLTIDRFIYDPDNSSGEFGATVFNGAFRFVSGVIGKNSPTSATISTPTASIGIRGTFFEGIVGIDAVALAQLGGIDTTAVNAKNASLIILRGPGPNSNSLDKKGRLDVTTVGGTIPVTIPNFAVFDPGNGSAPIGPFPVTEKMQEYLDFFLRSTPNGPTEDVSDIDDDIDVEAGQDKFEPSTTPDDQDPFDELVDGIQDSLTKQFCTDSYGTNDC